jgi:hypothetical protein
MNQEFAKKNTQNVNKQVEFHTKNHDFFPQYRRLDADYYSAVNS